MCKSGNVSENGLIGYKVEFSGLSTEKSFQKHWSHMFFFN